MINFDTNLPIEFPIYLKRFLFFALAFINYLCHKKSLSSYFYFIFNFKGWKCEVMFINN